MQSLGNILHFEFEPKNKKIADKAKEAEAIKIWEKVFASFCPNHAGKTMPLSYKGGVLNVVALHQEAADAVQFSRGRLIEQMNIELGRKIVWWINCES
jgi:hypothetical protein